MLNTPTSVDSLPRLRRFTSSQTQLSSFAYLGHDEGPGDNRSQETKDTKDETNAKESAGTPRPSSKHATKEKEDEQEEERKKAEHVQSKGETRSSEVLCQPLSDIKRPASSRVKAEPQDRRDLLEVPLSGLNCQGGGPSQEVIGKGEVEGDAGGDDQKICCGFFFKVNGSKRIISRIACIFIISSTIQITLNIICYTPCKKGKDMCLVVTATK